MNLSEFLHFNNECPVCGEPLKLYFSVMDGPLWKASLKLPNILKFEQIKCKDNKLSDKEFFLIIDNETDCQLEFSNHDIFNIAQKWNGFFFKLCNEHAIEEDSSISYSIDPYKACYYRSTPFMDFQLVENDNWELRLARGTSASFDNSMRDEVCIFKVQQDNGDEKLYILNIDYENQATVLRFCKTTAEQRSTEDFEPKMFKKDLPLLSVRPNFDLADRDKLINRLDSWILMS